MIEKLIQDLKTVEAGETAARESLARRQSEVKELSDKAKELRSEIMTAMEMSNNRVFYSDLADVSLKSLPSQIIINDEQNIPEHYWVSPSPKLDKAAIKKDLKDGLEISGALLSNGGETISIKWRG